VTEAVAGAVTMSCHKM